MNWSLDLWIEYILRFSHLVAGISWIGSSFYFIWLDSSFKTPETPRHNVDGEVFMVHGGFYYQVDKKKIAPGELPKTLHWFKWEATLTFVTGYLLFIYLYYLNGASLLINPEVYPLNQWQAILLSLALIFFSWLAYDSLWNPKVKKSFSIVGTLLFFSALIYITSLLFSGRGFFIIIGVIFGTSMLLNVWVRILPGQRRMLEAAQAGIVPDYSESAKSKVRSVHNTYFIFPVLFIMLSNHYPAIYNHQYSWLLLILLSISGACVRHVMLSQNPRHRWLLAPATLGVIFLIYITAQKPELPQVNETITYSEVSQIVNQRCLSCHSHSNSDDLFKVAPNGVILETESQILQFKPQIIQQVVNGKTMPFLNKTNMTDTERARLHKWLSQAK